MKQILFLLLTLFSFCSFAQTDSWKVVYNGKQRIATTTEDAEKNCFSISAADLQKNGFLWITYTEAQKKAGWKRVIALFDERDNELIKHGGPLFKVQNADLSRFFSRTKTIKIYTWSLPTDPKLAAAIRIRRVQLATIILK